MDAVSASGSFIPREPITIVSCYGCGRFLSINARYDGKKIESTYIGFEHDENGIFCPSCRPSYWSELPDDGGAPHRDPLMKEHLIGDALDAALPEGLTVLEIEEETGINRTTVYRRLEALERRGDVRHEGNKFFLKN